MEMLCGSSLLPLRRKRKKGPSNIVVGPLTNGVGEVS